MADKDPEVVEEKAKSKLAIFENKAILLGVIVIVQAVVAIGLTQFVIVPRLGVQSADMGAAQPAEESEAEMPEMGVLLGLEEIIVTLAGDAQRPRYLRISVNIELKDQMTADVVATRLPQLRDIVIMVLSEKTAAELSLPEGKKGLRDEIFRRIDEKMPKGILMNIYFSDLVVQ
ncbi:MAG: flagellar basal body-associated FliL family protein [Candidatus Krumholzibacteria bacterium]|nr:flagellar basal body-associated FliL family protein [Candidatus Krumholzibacteria bacterium]